MNLFLNKVRSKVRSLVLSFAGSFATPKPGIHILNSHFVSLFNSNYALFDNFLFNLKNYGEFVRIEEAVNILSEKKIPRHDVLIAFTFDDGFEECASIIAPTLEKHDCNAAFFINGGFIDGNLEYKMKFTNEIVLAPAKKPMSRLEIRKLSCKGHIIGSHTFDHINMNSSDVEFVESQIRKNKLWLKEITNENCDYFAFPFGQLHHINKNTLKIALKYHKYIFSGTNYRNYYSCNGQILNRRHIEPDWPPSHIKYFLDVKKIYDNWN